MWTRLRPSSSNTLRALESPTMPLKVMEVFEDNGTSNFVQREYDSSLEDPVQVAEVVDSTLKFQVYTLNM